MRLCAFSFSKTTQRGDEIINDFNFADEWALGEEKSGDSEKISERVQICFLRQMAEETQCLKYIWQVVSEY